MTVQCSLGHDNPDGSAFCDECGEPLASVAPTASSDQQPTVLGSSVAEQPQQPQPVAGDLICPSCGASNPAGESFCSNCGVSLLGGPVITPPPVEEKQEPAPVVTAGSSLQARLIVEADNQEFDISGKDNITVGREDAVSSIYPDIDLTPHGGDEGGVSRLHARIFYENGQYLVEDENSTNFTFVNRQRLQAKTPTPIQDNDEVRFGRVILRFKTP